MKTIAMMLLAGALVMGCSDDDEKTIGPNCKALKDCCASLTGAGKTACDKAYGLTSDNETVCKTSMAGLQTQGYCKATTDAGPGDSSTGDTSTGDTSVGDTSAGDTSAADTSAGDTSAADTSSIDS